MSSEVRQLKRNCSVALLAVVFLGVVAGCGASHYSMYKPAEPSMPSPAVLTIGRDRLAYLDGVSGDSLRKSSLGTHSQFKMNLAPGHHVLGVGGHFSGSLEILLQQPVYFAFSPARVSFDAVSGHTYVVRVRRILRTSQFEAWVDDVTNHHGITMVPGSKSRGSLGAIP
jgi:hypothetical protein